MEEGLECEVHVDGIRLELVSKFKNLGCVWDKAGIDGAECSMKVAGAIRSLFNSSDLEIECARILHETLLVRVLTYGSETML